MADGEVVYSTRADNSQLDEDLNQTEKKIDSKFSKIGSVAGKAAKVTGAAFAAIGSAAIAVGTKAVTGAAEFDKAMNQFAASTGTAQSELSAYEDTLKSIYANNYGESYEDIADAMAKVTQQMGELDQASLQNITESAFTLRDTFGYDVAESTRAAGAMVKQFGIDGDQAMNLIATGAQNGLDFSGELLDSISEYSVQFAKVGLNADDMFKIMQKGAETGAWNLDKVGDAIKEMSIRVVDGSDTTKQGFEAIGLNAEEMASAFSKGGESARKAFDKTVQALAKMDDPLQQNIAGVNLFGTMWEDLGPEVVTALADIEDGVYATADGMDELKSIKYDNLGSMLGELKRQLELLLIPLGEALIPLLGTLMEAVSPLIEALGSSLTPIFEQLGEVLQVLSEPLGVLIGFLSEILGFSMQIISEALTPILDLAVELLEPLMELLDGILQPLMDILRAIMEPLLDLIQTALEPILSLIGSLIEPLTNLVHALLPPIQELFSALTPILQTLFAALEPIFSIFSEIAGVIGDALGPAIETLASIFGGVLGDAIQAVMPILETLMDVLGGLIDFISGVFAGNWEQAWDGIVSVFKGIFNLIPSIIEGVINGAIGIINGIIKGINALTGLIGIPEIPLIPDVHIPRFHAGGIVDFKADGEGLALLKEGEMVLTQAQQSQLFALANGAPTAGGQQTVVVTSPVYLDGREISRNVTQHQYTDVMARRYK